MQEGLGELGLLGLGKGRLWGIPLCPPLPGGGAGGWDGLCSARTGGPEHGPEAPQAAPLCQAGAEPCAGTRRCWGASGGAPGWPGAGAGPCSGWGDTQRCLLPQSV